MRNQKAIKWLYQQLPSLIENGVISSEAAGKIKQHFGEVEEKPDYNIAFLVAGVLGAVLIGGGIILIFAYNWENLSTTWRTIFSFLPLVFAQAIYTFVFFKKRGSNSWVEASSGFLMLMLASSIALISQTYHIAGNMESFLLIWMLLSIPLLYLMNSSLAAIFYLIGISSFAINQNGSESVYYWAFMLAFIPHFIINVRKNQPTTRGNLLGWTWVITLAVAYFWVIEFDIVEYSLFGTSLIVSIFYLTGELTYNGTRFIDRPFQSFAIFVLFIICMALSFNWGNYHPSMDEVIYGNRYDSWAGMVNFGFLLTNILGFAILGYLYLKERKNLNYFVLAFPIFVIIGLVLTRFEQELAAVVFTNGFLFIYGLFYVKTGIQKHQMGLVNVGMFFISALLIARFFDSDWNFIIKGVSFVLLGIGFLSTNLLLSRKLKASRNNASN